MVIPRAVRCPTCGQIGPWQTNPNRPFCSERCRLADLGNWVVERYRIPGGAAEPDSSSDDDDSEN